MSEELLLTPEEIKDAVYRNSESKVAWPEIVVPRDYKVSKAQLAKAKPLIEKRVRWEVGEELCIIIGNKMLEDLEVGKLLGNQLKDYINNYLKGGQHGG